MWSHIYTPKSRSDVGVHPKKIQEVDDALTELKPLVILYGPTGSGKETALRVLCKEKKWDVVEWTTHVVDNFGDAFLKFLSDARQAGSLDGERRGRAVLVKDIPFSLWEHKEDFPERFAQLLRKGGASFPLYFCVNDYFHLRCFANAHVITFNAVATTYLTKAMERLVRCSNTAHPGKARLKEIVQMSQGDLRAATNALQLGCVTLGAERLGLFHALGRLLYNKRLADKSDTNAKPKQLPHDQMVPKATRPPLYFEVDEVMANSGASAQQLVNFCFTNAPYFTSSLADLADIQDHLSRVGTRRNDASDIAHEVGLRGMLDANLHPVKPTQGLFQFVRPRWRECTRHINDRRSQLSVFGTRAIETDICYMHQMLTATRGDYPSLAHLRHSDMQVFVALHQPWGNAEAHVTQDWTRELVLPPQQPLLDDITDFDD